MTMDLENAFDPLNNDFLLCILKNFGFGDLVLLIGLKSC